MTTDKMILITLRCIHDLAVSCATVSDDPRLARTLAEIVRLAGVAITQNLGRIQPNETE
jgi:hypothetical protein